MAGHPKCPAQRTLRWHERDTVRSLKRVGMYGCVPGANRGATNDWLTQAFVGRSESRTHQVATLSL